MKFSAPTLPLDFLAHGRRSVPENTGVPTGFFPTYLFDPSHTGINQVWNIISDVGGVYKYQSLVNKSPQLSKNASGIGSKRRCEFYDGGSVVEEVVGMKEGEELNIALSEFSLPFKSAEATMKLKKASDISTYVTIQMSFEMKYGVFGKFLGFFMIRPIMKMMFSKVLKGLSDHATTGQLVGEKGALLRPA